MLETNSNRNRKMLTAPQRSLPITTVELWITTVRCKLSGQEKNSVWERNGDNMKAEVAAGRTIKHRSREGSKTAAAGRLETAWRKTWALGLVRVGSHVRPSENTSVKLEK